MIEWIIRRLLQSLLVVIVMTAIVFFGVSVIGDPVEIMIAPDASLTERQATIEALGLDLPLWQQYFRFMAGAVQGDFGQSFVYNQPAFDVILQRMPATLELAITAVSLSLVIGLPLGLYAGLKSESPISKALMAGSILGFSLPTFWVGLLLILIFAVNLGWFPSGGRGETAMFLGLEWSFLTADGLKHLILPAANLALFNISLIMRLVRAGVAEILPQEFIKFARAKGLSERRVIGVYVLRNIMIPVVTIVGLELGTVVAFAVVTETIFAWPGMGKLIIDSINLLDRPIIVAYLAVIVIFFVIVNFLVDFTYTLLDPRIGLDNRK